MANISIRIDAGLKKDAEAIFENIGLSASTAINLFYKQVVRTRSIPFDLIADEPNKETIDAMNESELLLKDGSKGSTSIEELKKNLEL